MIRKIYINPTDWVECHTYYGVKECRNCKEYEKTCAGHAVLSRILPSISGIGWSIMAAPSGKVFAVCDSCGWSTEYSGDRTVTMAKCPQCGAWKKS